MPAVDAHRTNLNLPNALSALRFPLAVLFPLAGGLTRVALLGLAAASDWIDGRIARGTRNVTRLGEVLDPIADKTFMVVVLLTLAAEGVLPLWTLPLLLLRDIGVALGAMILAARDTRLRIPARRAGKTVTWLQFLAIAVILIAPDVGIWLAPLVGAAGLVALVDYARAVRGPTRSPTREARP
jgi:CDP-diacylglycerol--glycerol-3-phosphate 3-phosphatidyltransferase/cardiolipin synthase